MTDEQSHLGPQRLVAASEATRLSSHPHGGSAPDPADDPPDEETGQFGDSSDPGLESDEDLDGEHDADGGAPLHSSSS